MFLGSGLDLVSPSESQSVSWAGPHKDRGWRQLNEQRSLCRVPTPNISASPLLHPLLIVVTWNASLDCPGPWDSQVMRVQQEKTCTWWLILIISTPHTEGACWAVAFASLACKWVLLSSGASTAGTQSCCTVEMACAAS